MTCATALDGSAAGTAPLAAEEDFEESSAAGSAPQATADAPADAVAAAGDVEAAVGSQEDAVAAPRPPQSSAESSEAVGPAEDGTPEPEIVPDDKRWFRSGDVVVGTVVWANNRGARIQLFADPGIIAYMPNKESPYLIKSPTEESTYLSRLANDDSHERCIPVGITREFQVLKVPVDMSYNGLGPLLSARLVDLDLLWGRAEQLLAACTVDRENLRVVFHEGTEGGIVTRLGGLPLFLPASFLIKDPRVRLSAKELEEQKCGMPLEVTITQADARERRFTASERDAALNKRLSKIKVGSMVAGTVRRIDKFGCFVGLDDVGRVSGLLHISNISRDRVDQVEDVLEVGDKIKAVILGMDSDFSRISLSTADLEANHGDMITDKESVFQNAEAQYAIFLEQVNDEALQDRLQHDDHVRTTTRGAASRAEYE